MNAGADAIGLVFYPGSPRAVSLEQAAAVIAELPPLVTAVGLFVNAERKTVEEACAALPLGLLQFHGEEDAGYCASFRRPWMKAIRVADDTDVSAVARTFPGASALLLDTYREGRPGGTGEVFDWGRVPGALPAPVFLAGGLSSANVGRAIDAARPFAVDVSGGVEAEPGVKDPVRVKEFIEAVRAADTE